MLCCLTGLSYFTLLCCLSGLSCFTLLSCSAPQTIEDYTTARSDTIPSRGQVRRLAGRGVGGGRAARELRHGARGR